MSKRCELQKEYYKECGHSKGVGKYTDHYVNWLENKVLELNTDSVIVNSLLELKRYEVNVGHNFRYLLDDYSSGDLVKWEDVNKILFTYWDNKLK